MNASWRVSPVCDQGMASKGHPQRSGRTQGEGKGLKYHCNHRPRTVLRRAWALAVSSGFNGHVETRFFPVNLATYIASSAAATNQSGVAWGFLSEPATPMLAVTFTIPPKAFNSSTATLTRSAV